MFPNQHEENSVVQSDKTPQTSQLNHLSQTQDDGGESIHTVSTIDQRPGMLNHMSTHVSHSHDAPMQHYSSYVEVPDEVYDRLPHHQKVIIVTLLSFCGFLAPISSTTILAAVPEVAHTYNSTGAIINLSNALYMLFMGVSPCFWGPLSQVYGRRYVGPSVLPRPASARLMETQICLITALLFLGCSLGTALSPNLTAYFIFRILTAFEGTSFLTIGASCIGDIYRPTERATAMGWFLSGTLIGPAFGPFIGGIIVTFKSWRVIFYLQTALAGVALVGAWFFLPETAHHRKVDDLVGLPLRVKAGFLWRMLNPWRVVKLYKYVDFQASLPPKLSGVFCRQYRNSTRHLTPSFFYRPFTRVPFNAYIHFRHLI
jgi:MFS family permease